MKEPFDQGNKEKFTQNTQGQSSPVPVTHSLRVSWNWIRPAGISRWRVAVCT